MEGNGRARLPPSRGGCHETLATRKFGLGGSLALPLDSFMSYDDGHIGRRRPASGVFISLGQPTIVFLTVVTKDRVRWLANDEVHQALCEAWKAADAWMVGGYILMPDHLHLFAAPVKLEFTFDAWVRYWKSYIQETEEC